MGILEVSQLPWGQKVDNRIQQAKIYKNRLEKTKSTSDSYSQFGLSFKINYKVLISELSPSLAKSRSWKTYSATQNVSKFFEKNFLPRAHKLFLDFFFSSKNFLLILWSEFTSTEVPRLKICWQLSGFLFGFFFVSTFW